ncbi:MAG: sugar transferase [Actinobacteria bacterium]|nr:sugar transferase [Actinomycetota bacterium]
MTPFGKIRVGRECREPSPAQDRRRSGQRAAGGEARGPGAKSSICTHSTAATAAPDWPGLTVMARAGQEPGPRFRGDLRSTRAGSVIRRFSIDELPQLAHVLTGRMPLVGPRPLAADSGYNGAAGRRLLVRPGLTGLWHGISGRSRLSLDDSVGLDLYYVENWSLGLDMTILDRTIIAVLTRSGAYWSFPPGTRRSVLLAWRRRCRHA